MSMGISSISGSMNFDPTAMFKKIDSNADNSISKDEFLAGIKKQDGDSDEKLLKMFEETDSDGDGKISQAENEAALQKMAQGGQRPQGMQGPPPTKGAQGSSQTNSSESASSSTTYDVRDTNKDGEVSVQEKLEYIMKLIEDNQKADAAESEYTASGEATFSSSQVSTTFSMKA